MTEYKLFCTIMERKARERYSHLLGKTLREGWISEGDLEEKLLQHTGGDEEEEEEERSKEELGGNLKSDEQTQQKSQ